MPGPATSTFRDLEAQTAANLRDFSLWTVKLRATNDAMTLASKKHIQESRLLMQRIRYVDLRASELDIPKIGISAG